MKHSETNKSVMIRPGLYSSTIFEMEIWTLEEENELTGEDYRDQLAIYSRMDCGLHNAGCGLFSSKERALDGLEMMYDDAYDANRDLYCAFIRERAMYCIMQPCEYLKEWTYVHGLLHDESIVRNYDEINNPFVGRPKEMVRYKRGDIVMIPDGYLGHWGIVWGTPVTPEYIKEVNDQIESETGTPGNKFSIMDWSDDCYCILTNGDGFEGGHEHISAHHVLPALNVPDFVRNTLEEGLQKAMEE